MTEPNTSPSNPSTHIVWANPTFVLDPAEYPDTLTEQAIRTRLAASPMLRVGGPITLAPVGPQLHVGVEDLFCGPVAGQPDDLTERDAVFVEAAVRGQLPGILSFSPGGVGVEVPPTDPERDRVPADTPVHSNFGVSLLWATADLRLANKKDGQSWTEKEIIAALNQTAILHVEHANVREGEQATSVWVELSFGPVHSATTDLQDTANHILVGAVVRALLPETLDFSIRAWDYGALSRRNTEHMIKVCETDPVDPSWRSKVWWFVEDAIREHD